MNAFAVGWRVVVYVLLIAAFIEGVNAGLWLMNIPDDLAVIAGACLVVVSLLAPLGVGVRVLPWRSGKQDS